ncbi:LPS export ABC transporter periplasmic protein LptC [Salinibius halmophilus]|uniref:LPS export ABC transporter periplasmic protein LptC n=1 Tax=Salinibius halmophilus TaxID=1853216 RepID=UPI000E666358|nr:LPS export ABC transporter periplasmic protein LptC [Salinibius halmophilus]
MKQWLGVLTLIALGIAFALLNTPESAPNAAGEARRLQISASDLTRQQYDLNGNLVEQLNAETFQQFTNSNAEMTRMMLVQPDWTISANQATTEDQINFNLQGSVKVSTSDGLTLTTEKLLYQSNTETGHAPNYAELTRAGSISTGRSLKFDLTNEFMEFEQHESSTFVTNRDQ